MISVLAVAFGYKTFVVEVLQGEEANLVVHVG